MSVARPSRLPLGLLCAGLALMIGAWSLSGCTEVETETATGYEPSSLEPVKGNDDVKLVTFTPEGAKRIGLQTARVKEAGKRIVVPYASLIYDPEGKTYVYTSPRLLSYLRVPVEVVHIDGDRVLLSDGPTVGTDVVTVGLAEVHGTELEVATH